MAKFRKGNLDLKTNQKARFGDSRQAKVFFDGSSLIHNLNGTEILTLDTGVATVNGDVVIHGDATIDGTTFVINTQVITAEDPIITLNKGETGSGVTGGQAGLRIDRGTATDYQIIFNEGDDYFKVGFLGSEKRVALYQDATSYLHNQLTGLQGGDSTADEYYHLTKDIYDGLYSGSPIIGIGNQARTTLEIDRGTGDLIFKGDLGSGQQAIMQFDESSAYWKIGNQNHTYIFLREMDDGSDGSIRLYAADDIQFYPTNNFTIDVGGGGIDFTFTSDGLDVAGHAAIGPNASVNYGLNPASYSIPVVVAENSTVPDVLIGQYTVVENQKSGSGVSATGQYIFMIHGVTTDIDEITGINDFVSIDTDSATVDLMRGITSAVGHTADNTTVTEAIAGEFLISTGYSSIASEITTAIGGKFQLLNYGSGQVNITDGYGVQIKAPGFNSTGTTTNLYGLYIEDQLSGGFTNTYNIYSAGSTAENYIEGNLQVDGELSLASGVSVNDISDDTFLTNDSTTALVTEHAVKAYVDRVVATDVIAGAETLTQGVNTISITFDTPQPDGEYAVVGNIMNNADANPSLYVHLIRNQSTTGFDVLFSGPIDSPNYEFAWVLARYNALPITAEERITDTGEVRHTDDGEIRLID